MSQIGQRIKELRIQNNMTQAELGELLGVQKAAIQKYESGSIVNLRADKVRKLCEIFRVYPRYFIFEEQEDFWSSIFGDGDGIPLIEKSDEMIVRFMEDRYGFAILRLVIAIIDLNKIGQSKVSDYIFDMHKIDEYKKQGGD